MPNMKTLPLCLLSISCLALAASGETAAERYAAYLARGMKTPETSKFFQRHEDPESHVVSWIIKPGLTAHNQQSFYFTTKSMTDDGRFLMFHRVNDELDRKVTHAKRLAIIDFLTDTLIPLDEVRALPFADVETDQIWYIKDDGICRRDLLVDPKKEIRVCDIPAALRPTASERRCSYWATHLTLTADRKKAFLDPDVSVSRDFYEDSRSRQVLLDLTDGTYEIWGEQNYWVNHGQLHPTNPRLAMCAYEGCSKKWVTDSKGGRQRVPRPADEVYPRLLLCEPGRLTCVPSKIVNYATHEHWAADGKGFYWCASGVQYCDLATGRQTTICPLVTAHATMTADHRYVTGDLSWGGWWRGCGWGTHFWNRDAHRGVKIHTKRPVYAPQDKPSNIHPDPHPQFVCADRYVLCSMNVKDHQLTTSLTPVSELVRMTTTDATPIAPKRIPLEWNPNRDVSVPYEVTIDCKKLENAKAVAPAAGQTSVAHTAFAVEATVGGKAVPVPVEALQGGTLKEVNLRFKVPGGTTALTCIADAPGRFEVQDSESCDNLFAGALDAAHAPDWTCTQEGFVSRHRNGILLEGTKRDNLPHAISYTVPVPDAAAGKPVKLELDVRSLSEMTWPNPIVIRQLDAKGKELPEAVVDPRWTGHMRPPEKTCFFREPGRIHPDAKKLRIDFTLRWMTSPFDNHGLPLENPEALKPKLLITRLALRPAAILPFPGYDDANFCAGVSGKPGDCAIRLGGENVFWYQTRSQASWAEARPMREERMIFFPRAAGTVEAWFRPEWPEKPASSYHLFEAPHTGAHTETSTYLEGRGRIFEVRYDPLKKSATLAFIDWKGKRFTGSGACEIPSGKWTHVAATWQPDGEAALWINGKKAFSFPIKGFAPFDLEGTKWPNDAGPVEFYLGGSHASGRATCDVNPALPFVPGAADLLRVSTGVRYASDFTPATSFTCDANTRALFGFDREFDGVSGGGIRFVSGCYRALTDRRRHALTVGDKTFDYYPQNLSDRANPKKVLHDLKYTVLPTTADFKGSRAVKREARTMVNGDKLSLECPKGVVTDFIEYENIGSAPLAYPLLINKGEIDPRSFGDIADSLALGRASDWDRCNRLFDLVLRASDYSQNHLATFSRGSDVPRSVEYEALMMLNAYCGFECGPLNNLAANIFACSGGCPAAQTGGIGHSFEEVFFDRQNHIYDLSARKFFPAMDNETVAYLANVDAEPYVIGRMGGRIGGFVRNGTRGHYVQNPSYQEKVGMVLNPGERFRIWRQHDGEMNDLQLNSCWPGNRRLTKRKTCFFKSDVEKEARAKCRTGIKGGRPGPKGNTDDDLARLDRFFPESAGGYLVFDGRPMPDNPAFRKIDADSFAYHVKSGYPVVHGEYRAEDAAGKAFALELSTDYGKTWFPLPAEANGDVRTDYPVRARLEYLIRVKAPMATVARFRATTTIQANRRLLPGELKAGRNELTFKATGAGTARVTMQYRVPAKQLEIKGGLYTGTIPGSERQLVLVEPGQTLTLDVAGASPQARVAAHGGLSATLANGRLTLIADSAAKGGYRSSALTPVAAGKPYLTAVDITDGAATKQLTVLVAANARLVPAAAATLAGGAKLLPVDGGRANAAIMLSAKGQTARFAFPKLPAGRYVLMNLTRYQSALEPLGGHYGAGANRDIELKLPGMKNLIGAGAQESLPDAYWWTTIGTGKPGARGNFKWEYPCDPYSYYPYQLPGYFDLPADAWAEYSTPEAFPGGIELAGVLVVPDPSRDFMRDLRKVLCGFNCAPWTCRATD